MKKIITTVSISTTVSFDSFKEEEVEIIEEDIKGLCMYGYASVVPHHLGVLNDGRLILLVGSDLNKPVGICGVEQKDDIEEK